MTTRRLRLATLVLGLIGLGIAGYLTYVHYAGLQPFCLAGGGGCEKVQTSEWAKLAGVPVAVIGLVGYVLILGSLLLAEETGKVVAAFLALGGLGFSAYLTYRELFSIHAICQWCVASAVVMALLAIVSIVRLLHYEEPEPVSAEIPKRTKAQRATDAPAATSR